MAHATSYAAAAEAANSKGVYGDKEPKDYVAPFTTHVVTGEASNSRSQK